MSVSLLRALAHTLPRRLSPRSLMPPSVSAHTLLIDLSASLPTLAGVLTHAGRVSTHRLPVCGSVSLVTLADTLTSTHARVSLATLSLRHTHTPHRIPVPCFPLSLTPPSNHVNPDPIHASAAAIHASSAAINVSSVQCVHRSSAEANETHGRGKE
eukprot:3741298-Rhodomonas_salina.1